MMVSALCDCVTNNSFVLIVMFSQSAELRQAEKHPLVFMNPFLLSSLPLKHNEHPSLIRYCPWPPRAAPAHMHACTHTLTQTQTHIHIQTHTSRVKLSLINQSHSDKALTQHHVCSIKINNGPWASAMVIFKRNMVAPPAVITMSMNATERSRLNKRIPPYKYLSVINISRPN